jgi:DNA mismatch repair protein MutS
MSRETPMLRQYRQIKARYPDALVLYRLGDFYELFEEDARVAARDLGLVLTSRRFSKQVRLPMCGVPYRTVTSYIARLIERGHKVALAEQLEDARKARGLVKRDVVRVITPGTVVEEALLQEKTENYLAALVPGKKGKALSTRYARDHLRLRAHLPRTSGAPGAARPGRWVPGVQVASQSLPQDYGLAFVDLSTGEFAATEASDLSALLEELQRLQPSELVLPAELKDDETFVDALAGVRPARLSSLPDAEFAPKAAADRLRRHLGVASLEAYGCADLPLAAAAAGAVLAYLQSNQPEMTAPGDGLAHLRHLTTYSLAGYMHLDSATRRNLELTHTLRDGRVQGSLFGVLDHTTTAMGARLLRRWINQPLLDLDAIHARLDAVEELVGTRDTQHESRITNHGSRTTFLRTDLCQLLDGLHDVERLVGRIGFGNANGRDLVALKRALGRLPKIKARLADARSARLCALGQVDEHTGVLSLISRAIVDRPPILVKEGGLIRRGYYPELDQLRASAEAGRDWLADYEAAERERTGIKNLRVKYNQVFGFFIEVTKSNLKFVPDDYERRATITHAERFTTPALKVKEAEILAAEDRAKELEYDLFVDVRRRVAEHAAGLRQVARMLAELDALASLAEVAARHGYVRPVVDDGDQTEIREGRHPVVERLAPDGARFVPNDACLNRDGDRLLIVTGPNMAGKSVYIRQVALIVLMAQMGSFCPAASARIGLADRIFVRAGASDDITQGRSTFLVEMSETAYILRHATPRSLIVLDEVGRGTSTYDGVGLAWAVGEHLHNQIGARVLFATHYHELTGLADHLSGAKNYTLAVKEQGDDVIFLRRVVPGGADRSYGIHVARLAGLPQGVVERAESVMKKLEQERGAGKDLVELEGGGVLREVREPYLVGGEEDPLLLPVDDAALREVIRELFGVDIANLTPVQALVRLNEWQRRLRGERFAGRKHR